METPPDLNVLTITQTSLADPWQLGTSDAGPPELNILTVTQTSVDDTQLGSSDGGTDNAKAPLGVEIPESEHEGSVTSGNAKLQKFLKDHFSDLMNKYHKRPPLDEMLATEWITGGDPKLRHADMIGSGGSGSIYRVSSTPSRAGSDV